MPVELGAQSLWTLGPLSAAVGIVAVSVFRWGADGTAVRRTMNRMLAHVLEFRLFLDEPVLVLCAQRELLLENLRLLRLLFLPCLILAVPFFLSRGYLNDRYGRAPLQPGRAAVIVAERLSLPKEILAETPAVRAGGELVWRVRPVAPVPVRLVRAANPSAAIPFPSATILHLNWLFWFTMISSSAAIGLTWLK
jgi:hypothetical protein